MQEERLISVRLVRNREMIAARRNALLLMILPLVVLGGALRDDGNRSIVGILTITTDAFN